MRKSKKRGGWLTWNAILLATTALGGMTQAHAQEEESGGVGEIIVTATKRAENLQDVPVSVQALDAQRLQDLNITDFADYAQHLPTLSYSPSYGPGYNRPFMRGVASGENGNHSGSMPSVGTYLDEQPITTITGNLDMHIYDVARVEVLAGPQGTLYGASSQAGTVRIITNRPDTDEFSAAYDLEVNAIRNGGWGQAGEGYVNIPISDRVAVLPRSPQLPSGLSHHSVPQRPDLVACDQKHIHIEEANVWGGFLRDLLHDFDGVRTLNLVSEDFSLTLIDG